MSEFTVEVVRVEAIEPIEGADKIELAVVGEYRSIIAKGSFKAGDLAVYLPEQAVLPDWLIEKLNLVGKLSGSQKNRIKAIKLKGVLSQGILYPVVTEYPGGLPYGVGCVRGEDKGDEANECFVNEGDDVSEFLGVKKYDPTEAMTPSQLKLFHGTCVYIPGYTVAYDLQNWKKYSRVFEEGEEVVMTEKLHGTMCCFARYPGLNNPNLPDDKFIYSKGLGKGGQVFKWTEENENNAYLRAFRAMTTTETVRMISDEGEETEGQIVIDPLDRAADILYAEGYGDQPFFLFGEVFGKGVQDLAYDAETPTFRAFDLWVGTPQNGHFIDANKKHDLFEAMGIPRVPVLYQGPYYEYEVKHHTDGMTCLGAGNIREGIVITSAVETKHPKIGRKALKNVSGDYLTRKGNATEFN